MQKDFGENDARPWERYAIPRRDCEPHRGHLLKFLGNASVGCGFVTMLVLIAGQFGAGTVPTYAFPLPGLLGVSLGIAVRGMASRDLAKMGAGLMDPGGRRETVTAWAYAVSGAILSFVCSLFCSWVLLNHWLL